MKRFGRHPMAWGLLCLGFAAGGHGSASRHACADGPPRVPPVPLSLEPAYLDHAALVRALEALVADGGPGGSRAHAGARAAKLVQHGTSQGGLALLHLDIGAKDAPCVLVHGGLGERDAAGPPTVLELAARILAAPPGDPALRWVLVPSPHPDAVEAFLGGRLPQGASEWHLDRDRDGRRGEDGPADLDGDGHILWMRRAAPRGEWVVVSTDDPPAEPAANGQPADGDKAATVEAGAASPPAGKVVGDPRWMRRLGDSPSYAAGPRYEMWREGRDDDGDGEVNEDPPGIDLTRQMCGVESGVGPWGGDGPYPGWAPETQALLDLSLALPRLVGWYAFGGTGDRILRANERGEVAELDRALYGRLSADLKRATGLAVARAGSEAAGSDLDWACVHLGVPAFRLPLLASERESQNGRRDGQVGELDWLLRDDRQNGGLGFRAWQPFDHPTLGRVEIGGWLPYARYEPTPAALGAAIARVVEGPLAHMRHVPRLGLDVEARACGGDLFEIVVRVVDAGSAPLETKVARARGLARDIHVSFLSDERSELVAGTKSQRVSAPEGGAASEPRRWLVRVPAAQPQLGRVRAWHRIGGEVLAVVARP